jgi:hypothetical protein
VWAPRIHDEWHAADRRHLPEGSMTLLNPEHDADHAGFARRWKRTPGRPRKSEARNRRARPGPSRA